MRFPQDNTGNRLNVGVPKHEYKLFVYVMNSTLTLYLILLNIFMQKKKKKLCHSSQ